MIRTFTVQDRPAVVERDEPELEAAAQAAADALGLPCGAVLLELDDEGDEASAWQRSGLTGRVVRIRPAIEDLPCSE